LIWKVLFWVLCIFNIVHVQVCERCIAFEGLLESNWEWFKFYS
jgi:hypothetical protein